jgi:hypothetical protein
MLRTWLQGPFVGGSTVLLDPGTGASLEGSGAGLVHLVDFGGAV